MTKEQAAEIYAQDFDDIHGGAYVAETAFLAGWDAREAQGKGEAVTIFGPVDTSPPAPKDERVAALVEAVKDFKENGGRFDLNPTQPLGDWEDVTSFFLDYLRRIDESIRMRGAEALRAFEGGEK